MPQQAGYSVGPLVGVAAWEWWGDGVWLVVGPFALVAAVLVAIGAGLRRRPDPADAESEADPTRPDLDAEAAALLTPQESISGPAPEPLTLTDAPVKESDAR